MLAAANRVRSRGEFAHAIRRGVRAGTDTVVLHLVVSGSVESVPPRVGFVVSKAVGHAVMRNTVKRRLRSLVRERISSLPGGAVLVVRALPAAAGVEYSALGRDLDRALTRVLDQAGSMVRVGSLQGWAQNSSAQKGATP